MQALVDQFSCSLSHITNYAKYFPLQYRNSLHSYQYDIIGNERIPEEFPKFLGNYLNFMCKCVASWKALEVWSSWHRFMHVDIMYNSMHSTRATLHRTIDHPRVPFKNIAPTKRCAIISGTMSLECIFSRRAPR